MPEKSRPMSGFGRVMLLFAFAGVLMLMTALLSRLIDDNTRREALAAQREVAQHQPLPAGPRKFE